MKDNLQGRVPLEDIYSFPRSEVLKFREDFTPEEKKALKKDGALIYKLTGQTLQAIQEAQQRKGIQPFVSIARNLKFIPSGSDGFVAAIYPQPSRFFVPDSLGKTLAQQEELAAADAKALQERLQLPDITQIIPAQPSTLVDIAVQHAEAIGEKWLFGRYYAGLNVARTKQRTLEGNAPFQREGLQVAYVGETYPERGFHVGQSNHYSGNPSIGVMRLVVPIQK